MNFIKSALAFKSRLTRFNEEQPLGKLSLTIVILLDIFLLSVVFVGLDAHTAQLSSVREYFPHECRQALIEDRWSNANKLDRLQSIVLNDYNNYLHRDSFFDEDKLAKMHPDCKKYFQSVKAIAENQSLKNMFIERQSLERKRSNWRTRHNIGKDVYDTQLLEKIADNNSKSGKSVTESMREISTEYEKINARLTTISSKISNAQLVKDFFEQFGPSNSSKRDNLISDLKRYKVFYALKELCWQFLFLLPIFAGALFWHIRSTNKKLPTQTLFSAHLLTIASIPILFKIVELVLDLIPNTFFRALFKLLEKLHIIALWHYLLIVVALFVAILIVYLIQKKFFNKQRVYEKRLIAGKCWFCGKKLPPKSRHCPFCGKNQMRQCSHCQSDTFLGGSCCINCGK
ncbi:MAG: hypothetical protein K8R02_09605 [Anaerohalosphaeraceae bacterium]|nr:hypothetical protein [Anaerohalosphaeraceae bacterium]